MKKVIIFLIGLLFTCHLTACGRHSGTERLETVESAEQAEESINVESDEQTGEPAVHTPPPDEPVLTEIIIMAGEHTLEGVLFDNETGEEFEQMLPYEVTLWNPAPGFAKAFNLPYHISDVEERTRQYEKGGLAYWYEGPSVAIFYGDHLEQTIVPVVTIGRITSDVDFLEDYEGEITITKKEV